MSSFGWSNLYEAIDGIFRFGSVGPWFRISGIDERWARKNFSIASADVKTIVTLYVNPNPNNNISIGFGFSKPTFNVPLFGYRT